MGTWFRGRFRLVALDAPADSADPRAVVPRFDAVADPEVPRGERFAVNQTEGTLRVFAERREGVPDLEVGREYHMILMQAHEPLGVDAGSAARSGELSP